MTVQGNLTVQSYSQRSLLGSHKLVDRILTEEFHNSQMMVK